MMVVDDSKPTEFVRATPRGRLFSVALFVLSVALIAVFQFAVIPKINASLGHPTVGMTHMLKWTFSGFTALALLPAAALMIIGCKVLRIGQHPLPNAWVWRDTPIKHGDDAKRIGKLCMISGAIAWMICLALVAYIWIVFDRLSPALQLRPGITLLQSRTTEKP